MINKLIEKIGRERLEAIVYAMGAEPCDADPILDSVTHGDIGKMARALLAVLDAQSKPAAWIINCNSARINFAETEKNSVDKIIEECRESGTDIDITPLYTTPLAPSVPDGWKMMPLEPTQRMIDAHIEGMVSGGATRAYRDMLAAAPAATAPDGLAAAVNRLLDSDGSRGTFSAIRRGDALAEVERLLAAATAPGGDGG